MAALMVGIVTGAGSGVGQSTATTLAESGYRLALVGRTRSKLEDTAALIAGAGGDPAAVMVLPADVTSGAAVGGVVDQTIGRFGRIDAVANVAGYAPRQPLDQITPQTVRRCLDVNLAGPVLITAAAWPVFQRQKAGIIVNVSSMASIDPFPGFNLYAAAKAGLNMFTRCIAEEGKKIGVKAVCIAPGAIETPMLRRLFDTRTIPKDKTLDPMEVAGLIRDCVTGTRTFESGQTISLPSPKT